jgi:hypothetical protein
MGIQCREVQLILSFHLKQAKTRVARIAPVHALMYTMHTPENAGIDRKTGVPLDSSCILEQPFSGLK